MKWTGSLAELTWSKLRYTSSSLDASAGISGGRWFETRGMSWRNWCACDIEDHRDERVVAVHPDQIHHPLLSKCRNGARVCSVAHSPRLVQLGAEVVGGLQRLGQVVEPAAFGDRLDDG